MSPRGVCPKETSAPAPSDTFGTDSTMVQVQRSIPTPASCSQHRAKDGFSTQLISLGPLFFWLRCLCPWRTSFHPSPEKSSRGSASPEPPIWQSEASIHSQQHRKEEMEKTPNKTARVHHHLAHWRNHIQRSSYVFGAVEKPGDPSQPLKHGRVHGKPVTGGEYGVWEGGTGY